MNLQSIFGSIAIGKDSSGNFRQSIHGPAVKIADNKFIARKTVKKGHKSKETSHVREFGDAGADVKQTSVFIDASDFTIDGSENMFYKMPVKISDLVPGEDIVLRKEDPLSVLFVERVEGNEIYGYDPSLGDWITYTPISNELNWSFAIRITGPDGLFGDSDDSDMLPLLLASNNSGGTGGGSNDMLTTMLLMKTIGGKKDDKDIFKTLLLLNNAGNTGNDNLFTMLLLKNKDLF